MSVNVPELVILLTVVLTVAVVVLRPAFLSWLEHPYRKWLWSPQHLAEVEHAVLDDQQVLTVEQWGHTGTCRECLRIREREYRERERRRMWRKQEMLLIKQAVRWYDGCYNRKYKPSWNEWVA